MKINHASNVFQLNLSFKGSVAMEILVPLAFVVAFCLQAGEQIYRIWLKWKEEDIPPDDKKNFPEKTK
jgi:hypothetical protein